jgi:hypothetical protein
MNVLYFDYWHDFSTFVVVFIGKNAFFIGADWF